MDTNRVFLLFLIISPITVLCSYPCKTETRRAIERVSEASITYPEDTMALMCVLKVAFIEPNKSNPAYTNCVNNVRQQAMGVMKKGGTFNPQNLGKMQLILHSENTRQQIVRCMSHLHECYDVENLAHCLLYHQRV